VITKTPMVPAITYEGDFLIEYSGERVVCEDVKGFETEAFRIKWRWVQRLHPEIEFRMHKGGGRR
jgi:hypothetical protein